MIATYEIDLPPCKGRAVVDQTEIFISADAGLGWVVGKPLGEVAEKVRATGGKMELQSMKP